MSKKPKGKKIGFLMPFPFNSMMTDPFQSSFFANPPQAQAPQQQNPAPPQSQTQAPPQNQTQVPSQQRGFSFAGLDSMFQNAKTFMGYVDQVRPMVKNLGPMFKMFSGTQAKHVATRSQRGPRKAVYTRKIHNKS